MPGMKEICALPGLEGTPSRRVAPISPRPKLLLLLPGPQAAPRHNGPKDGRCPAHWKSTALRPVYNPVQARNLSLARPNADGPSPACLPSGSMPGVPSAAAR
ncbi:hypothetical protein Droror1_Dr00004545 [Drosera rotundifolia]